MDKQELHGGLNANQIKALKKKHNISKVHLITIEHEGEELFFWVKKPDMMILSLVSATIEKDPMGASKKMFLNCLLKGDKKYADDVDVFPTIMEELHKTLNKAKGKLEKF